MHKTIPLISLIGATLLATSSAYANQGKFYDPANTASAKDGKTIGHELFRTIGCPGRQLLDSACPDGDADGDGVVDSKDKCPTTPKGRKVNAEGCELDGDGDGIVDALDKCPTVPAPGTVDGCPVVKDSDGDGIMDDKDRCPTVPAPGTADGCPVPKKLTLEGVNFDNDKATLRPEAHGILDKAAATLKEWGDVKVEVAGHTDSRSDDDHNMKLSQRRAEAVRTYLIGKGVAADRLTAKGYGESTPLADNETEEGRFKNRRVELVPQK